MTGKILGIGLQRTGTTSLYEAMNLLGISAAPHAIPLFYDLNDPVLWKYEAFMDNPIPLIYKELDNQLNGCKFILTTRSKEDWLKSVQWLFENELDRLPAHLRRAADAIHRRFYGVTVFNRETFSRCWDQYHEEVHTYFADRPDDVLILNIDEQPGWDELCGFLGKEVPSHPFPHQNKST